jgi:6-phosphogluconolactonase
MVRTAMPKTVYYASIGPALVLYDIDVDGAELHRRATIQLPANIQYAWPHPARHFLYVVSSNGGPALAGDKHFANALAIDPSTGELRLHGAAAALPSRPIHLSVDHSGAYLLTAYNNPSNVTVHRLYADGTIGAPIVQSQKVDAGIYAHQILATPSNKSVLLVTRGNDAKPDRLEDPGAIKSFAFNSGALSGLASIAPSKGLGFGPRHLDFHPTEPWVFVSIERQNQLYVYRLDEATGLAHEPMFVANTLPKPNTRMRQAAGAIHAHPSGKFVYLTNRASDLSNFEGKPAVVAGENNVAVFAVDQNTGEPTLIQNADGHSVELRTFAIDPDGRMLVAASIAAAPVLQGNRVETVAAGLSVFRIADDGKLSFVRKYDVDTGALRQFWSGMVALP